MQQSCDFSIRNTLQPGDLGRVAEMHGRIYAEEHGFGIGFEAYVMESLVEFCRQYDSELDKVWVVEAEGKTVGFLSLMHRPEDLVQLRYFILEKEYRGRGIGKRLMKEWMECYSSRSYSGAYLYTTSGLDSAVNLYEAAGFRKVGEELSENFGVPMVELEYRLF